MIDTMSKQTQESINKILIDCALRLNFSSEPYKGDRLTIFGLRGDSFFAISRYSEHSEFHTINSNKHYALNKGCIAKGYAHGWHFVSANIPSYDKSPKEYSDFFRHSYNLKHNDIRDLSMKSRLYAVQRISRRGEKDLGVVVFESLRPNRITEEQIRNELQKIAELSYGYLKVLDMKAEQISSEFDIEIL